MWGCFLMSGVKILHFLKDWWKSIPIHQNYTMALIDTLFVNKSVCFFSVFIVSTHTVYMHGHEHNIEYNIIQRNIKQIWI